MTEEGPFIEHLLIDQGHHSPQALRVDQMPVLTQGPQGNPGPSGIAGLNGSDGKTVLNGTGSPGSGAGSNGDFYIDTANSRIYGPKSGGAWGSGTSIIGSQGIQGVQGNPGTSVVMLEGTGSPFGITTTNTTQTFKVDMTAECAPGLLSQTVTLAYDGTTKASQTVALLSALALKTSVTLQAVFTPGVAQTKNLSASISGAGSLSNIKWTIVRTG